MRITKFDKKPIGIFDSGVGGLSVWRELIKLMPGQEFIYIADNAFCPYGPRPKEEVIERSSRITEFLIEQGAAIVVVACNTATSAAISTLRSRFFIPFVGMEPAVKPAASFSKSGVIGVLATKGTLSGDLYNNTLERYASNVEVIEMAGVGLVQQVEEGKLEDPHTETLLSKYIKPMVEAGADHIVLGCTHYPFLSKLIHKIAGEGVTIIDPAPAVARHTLSLASELGIFNTGESGFNTTFYSTGGVEVLKSLAKSISSEIPDSLFRNLNI
jgi:glutamate racemase